MFLLFMLFLVSVLQIRMCLLFNVVSRVGVTDPDVGCFFSLMLFHVSVLHIRMWMWMFLLFNVVSRVGVTDPDVSSL